MRKDMKVLTSMNTAKWYTPLFYLNLVREVFEGPIDLDPASDPVANQLVEANNYFTPGKCDGLNELWRARNVFLNPPYSVEGVRVASTPAWMDKGLIEYRLDHYGQGIFLVNFKAGYKWMNTLLDANDTTVLLHRNRIAFVDPSTMIEGKPSRQPQATIYVGPYVARFIQVFGHLGWITGRG